jgi:hypothetical protein
MTEIPPPPPPSPSPSPDPRPFDAGGVKAPSGCQKPLLVGCGLTALLLGIGAIAFVMKAKDVLAYAMNQLRSQVVSSLPEEIGDREREALEASFERAIARIREGAIDPAALQNLQGKLVAAAQGAGSRKLTPAEVADLQSALDRFNAAQIEDGDVPDAAPADSGGAAEAPPN